MVRKVISITFVLAGCTLLGTVAFSQNGFTNYSQDDFIKLLRDEGIEKAVQAFNEAKKIDPRIILFDENAMDGLGFEFLEKGEPGMAVEIFKLNVDAYPNSANVYSSLAGAYLKTDNKKLVLDNYDKSIELSPHNDNTLRMLKQIVTTREYYDRDRVRQLKELIRNHPTSQVAKVVLTPPDEPGEPMVVSGKIQNTDGEPIEGGLIYVFQADMRGYNTPADSITGKMDEQNSRLFGYMKTGSDGYYEFRTIRPGGYPKPLPGLAGNRRLIPAHIHLTVTASGYRDHKCRSTCQLVFEDDPRMTKEWHDWAASGGNPVLKVTRDKDGIQRCVYNVVLQPI